MSREGDVQAKHLKLFRDAARDRVNRLNLAWIRLEQGSGGPEVREEFLREMHTLKGEASLMGFETIVTLVHALEEVTKPTLEGRVGPGSLAVDQVIDGLDLVMGLVDKDPQSRSSAVDAFLASIGAGTTAPVERPAAAPVVDPVDEGEPASGSAVVAPRAAETVRVTAGRLDRMRDMVGEVLLVQSRIDASARELGRARELALECLPRFTADPQLARMGGAILQTLAGAESRLRDDGHQIARLVHELDGVTRELRMTPIRSVLEQYPVAIRALARELGREVHLHFEGDAVEVDRMVLDRIAEPLLHLARNAVDHGIEDPRVREAAGKPRHGTLVLRARLVGRELQVEVADDGAGIDVNRVRVRALELGLIDHATAGRLSDAEVLRCLFLSGMSTRREATRVSGRGVGLNVVLANVEQLGGLVTITSQMGRGTTFLLSVPVSVAISAVLLFRVGSGSYALLVSAVEDILDSDATPVIQGVNGPVIRHPLGLLPLVSLPALLGEMAQNGGGGGKSTRIVVVRSSGTVAALAGLSDMSEREAVVKSAGQLFERQPLVGGAVPLADGSLALVLKAGELVTAARGRMVDRGRVPARALSVAAHGKTVLVADDSPIVRDLVAEALRSHGLRVIEASDGEEALAQFDAHPEVSFVVTDVEMPRLDGIGLIRAIRGRGGPRRIPIVVVSMRGSDDDKRRAVDAGADAYLVKSDFSHAGLWTLLSRFIEG